MFWFLGDRDGGFVFYEFVVVAHDEGFCFLTFDCKMGGFLPAGRVVLKLAEIREGKDKNNSTS